MKLDIRQPLKQVELFGRKFSVPVRAKYVFMSDTGSIYWTVNKPTVGNYGWNFPNNDLNEGNFGSIEFNDWQKYIKEV